MQLHNSRTDTVEQFEALAPPHVTVYSCGPTVYQNAHIGNLRSFVVADLLRRALAHDGYLVRHVMNITDVGHLTGDADTGEDKIEAAARTEAKSVEQIVSFYIDAFYNDLDRLNIDRAAITFARATWHITEQIELVRKLEHAGVTYTIADGVYLDTAALDEYPKLGSVDPDQLKAGARIEPNPEKRNPGDFALWKFSPADEERLQEWDSPWGVGFPGWHLECSAMATAYLGSTIDIHTGGVDLQFPHHANELAQCEAAHTEPFVRYWLHSEHMSFNGAKMAKSDGNTVTLTDLMERGIHPIAFRYWLCTAHYRSQVSFDPETVRGAETALRRLKTQITELPENGTPVPEYTEHIDTALARDLDTPTVIRTAWNAANDDGLDPAEKRATVAYALTLLGIDLTLLGERSLTMDELDPAVIDKLNERERARTDKDFDRADRIREDLRREHGIELEDTPSGPRVYRAS